MADKITLAEVRRSPHPDAPLIATAMDELGAETIQQLTDTVNRLTDGPDISATTLSRKIRPPEGGKLIRLGARVRDKIMSARIAEVGTPAMQERGRTDVVAFKVLQDREIWERALETGILQIDDDDRAKGVRAYDLIAIRSDPNWRNPLREMPYLLIVALGDANLYDGDHYIIEMRPRGLAKSQGRRFTARRYRDNPARFEPEPGNDLPVIHFNDIERVCGRVVTTLPADPG